MRTHIFILLFVVSIVPMTSSQTIIFQDNFESYTTGTLPTPNWVTRFSGQSAQVSEAVAHAGIKAFELVSRPSWARVEAHELSAIPDRVAYEGWVYLNQSDKGYSIGFGKTTSPSTYNCSNFILFGNNAKIYFIGNAVSMELQCWAPQTWYKVKVCCDFIDLKGRVWINDMLKAENVPLVARNNFSDFCLGGNNWTGSGTSAAYYDDIKLYTYVTTEFQDDFESYTTGTLPTPNWIMRFSGHSAQVSEAVAHGGIKSFELVSLPSWARVEAHEFSTIADYFAYEGWVYMNQPDKGCCFGFGKKTSPSTYYNYNFFVFGNDGKIHFSGDGVSLELQSWSSQTWYKVKLYCDFINAKGKVWVDDVLKAENINLVSRTNFSEFSMGVNNWIGTGTSTGYFDDIKFMSYIPCEQDVDVIIPDTTEEGDMMIDIPVYVTDVTDKGIYSFGLTVVTDPTILIPQSAITTGTITEPWGDATYNVNGGTLKIGVAGSAPLSGSGKLILLRYQVPAGVAHLATTAIEMTEFEFNDGHPPVNLHNGSFTVVWKFDVSGNTKYYSNELPIPGVDVSMDGHQITTGNSGDFQLLDVLYGNYTLRPEKTGSSAYAVGPYDAALILMSVVNLINLNPYQKLAGDVSGDGTLSSMDASYVLRYYVGLISEFPVGKDWTFVPTSFTITNDNWPTAPDSIRYEPLNADQTNQNFLGIIYGDVSGNWQVPPLAPNHWLAHADGQPQFIVGNWQPDKDGCFILPITITNVSDLMSMGMTCQYDQHYWQFVKAELSAVASSQPMFCYRDHNGTIKLALASATGMAEQATNLQLIFKPKVSIEKASAGCVSISEISINGKSYQLQAHPVETNLATIVPERFELSQNYPNPFNAETLIKYQLPQAGYLTIKIFNLLGQKIRTLVAEQKQAGFHQIVWDGRDDWNINVGSGEYLCQMQIGDFVAVKKVVLLR